MWEEMTGLWTLLGLTKSIVLPRPTNLHCLVSSKLKYSTLARRSKLMTQFDKIKEQYEDYILLFQVGDFYEIFDKDASLVSAKTSLRLTRKKNRFMCGFPVKSLSEWQKTLIQAGFQLVICDQVPPATKRSDSSLLDRNVVKIITPGTLIEPLHTEANYLLSIATSSSSTVGLAWADISTAEIKVSSSDVTEIDADLERISPSEVLLPSAVVEAVQGGVASQPTRPDHVTVKGLAKSSLLKECHLTGVPGTWYQDEEEEQGVGPDIKRLHLGQSSQLEQAATLALFRFIKHTQRDALPHLSSPTIFSQRQHMAIDASTRKSLEIITPLHSNTRKTTLLGCIDKTVTAAGARLLKARLSSPLVDAESIERRLRAVQVFTENSHWASDVIEMLKVCEDLERIMQKVATKNCNITDLQAIKTTLHTAGKIQDYVDSNFGKAEIDLLEDELEDLQHFDELVQVLDDALSGEKHGNYITEGYSKEVDSLRAKILDINRRTDKLVAGLQDALSLPRLVLASHKSFYRVLEVTKTHAAKAEKHPDLIRVDQLQAKTRFSHVELQKLNADLSRLETAYAATQDSLFKELCDKVMSYVDKVLKTASSLAKLDVATSLALLATENGYCKPSIIASNDFNVVQGFHPVVASQKMAAFVGNDCCLNKEWLWIVTGPNMGGKSTFLRQNALISILAQMGSFVPAESATLGVVDRLFARVGSSDNVSKHMSTFHLEMCETAHILNNATPTSLVILDEIGRGTSHEEGVALATAVLQYVHDRIGCRTLVATHYHQLALLEEKLSAAACYKLLTRRDQGGITFTYKIQRGYVTHSCALDVASLCGIPREVIHTAKLLQGPSKTVGLTGKPSHQEPALTSSLHHDGSSEAGSHPFPSSPHQVGQQTEVLKMLEDTSLDHMTPLGALNLLHQLKEELQPQK